MADWETFWRFILQVLIVVCIAVGVWEYVLDVKKKNKKD